MANSNYSDFKEIVRDIDDRKILLPDFQRDFVWKDEERQKNSCICTYQDANREHITLNIQC